MVLTQSISQTMRKDSPDEFVSLSEYWGFYETVGLMVRKKYIPFKDAYSLYKGPLVEIDRACTDFIGDWQSEAHIPSGLYENMLGLASRAARRDRWAQTRVALKFWGRT